MFLPCVVFIERKRVYSCAYLAQNREISVLKCQSLEVNKVAHQPSSSVKIHVKLSLVRDCSFNRTLRIEHCKQCPCSSISAKRFSFKYSV